MLSWIMAYNFKNRITGEVLGIMAGPAQSCGLIRTD